MIPVLQHYWISFIRTFDPNTYRLEGTPVWEEWTADGFEGQQEGRRRIVFQNTNNGEGKKTEMEDVDAQQWERCRVLSEWGVGLGQ